MTAPLFTIIGMGDDGPAGLAQAARERLDQAQVIVASRRLLDRLGETRAECHPWPSPCDPMAEKLRQWAGRNTVSLATGDPMWFGAGATLLRHFDAAEFDVMPHLSAFQLAAARMGWALQEVETLSLHGRPVSLIEPYIQPNARLIALTSGATGIRDIAGRFVARGFGDSAFSVLAHMGGKAETRVNFSAQAIPQTRFSGFHTLAIGCAAAPDAQILPRTPGLPDDAFVHDGQLTKRDIRAVTVAALAPTNGQVLWDVGAGCGSVAIEWLRIAPRSEAIAFERDANRIDMIAQNMDRLGAPQLVVRQGQVPGSLDGQPAPDAVFIGGAIANPDVSGACWAALRPKGRLVANAVTLDGETRLASLYAAHGGELMRIGIEQAGDIGTRTAMRPRMTVTQWRAVKP